VISAIIRFITIINLVITPMFTSFKTRTIITTGTTIINVAITRGNDLLGRFDYWDYMTSGFLPISGESLEHLYFYW
jgi:hypothetical protein